MPPPPLFTSGSRIAGYQVVDLVGRGGMGEVYRAKQLSMDREVALKILSPRLAKQDPSFASQFVAEARAAGKLNHPNIVAVHDVGNAPAPEGCNGLAAGETVHFFSMEFITGETVKDVIERQGSVDHETVALIMRGMTEALSYAEANRIVHRDVKPDNIMLPTSGGMKLADLGLAQQMGTEEAVAERDGLGRSKVVGTPLYMAPEQAQAKTVDHRADQYALGATLFHMLTGRPPYQGDNAKAIMRAHCFSPVPDPSEINPQVPPPWREICMRLMAKLPEQRYGTSSELRSAVKEAARWRPGAAPRRIRRTRGPWLGVSVAVAVAAAAAWFAFVWLPQQSSKPPEPQPVPRNDPPPPPTQPVKDPTTAAREKAAAALKALPADPEQAHAQIEKLLADPAMAPAADQLLARRQQLRQAIEEKRRAPMRTAMDEAERALESGRLRAAHAALDRVPESEEWPRGRRGVIKDRLEAADRALDQRLIAAIAAAADLEACDRLRDDIVACELPDAGRTAMAKRLADRRTAIGDKPKPVDTSAAWRAAGERIERNRGALPYAAFAEACEEAAREMPAPDREQIQALAGAAPLAEKVETALRLYLPTALPKVEARFGNRSGIFVITRLEKDWVWFRLVDIPAESRAERATANLPWAELAAAALATQGKPDPRMIAAYLWYWRQGSAAAALAKLGDDALARAAQTYDRRTRPLDLAGNVSRRDDALVVDYPFAAAKDKELLTAWEGEGVSLTDRGLRWAVDKLATSRNEADLPTLRWKTTLKPPMTLDAEILGEAGTEVPLIGLRAGPSTVRIALSYGKRKAFALATAEDGQSYEILGSGNAVDFNGLESVRVHLALAADGKVELSVNDKQIVTEKPLQLPAGAAAMPLIQVRQPQGKAAIVVQSLTITGRH